jgi:epoxyqueuosine reductase
MKEAIRDRARALGFDQCRFTTSQPPGTGSKLRAWLDQSRHGEMAYLERNAAKRISPELVLADVRSVICVAVSYFESKEPKADSGHSLPRGLVARYARYTDYHKVLGERLAELGAFVSQFGVNTKSLWYVDTGPVLERDFAQRAGVGFIGKHTNLISRSRGNWILLAEILTTLEIEPDTPEMNRCGSCTRCLKACPTQAITGPFQLDARLCISYLTIENKGPIPLNLRRLLGNRVFGCDDCLAVCPWNRFARAGELMRSHSRPELATPDLIELLSLDESTFRSRFRDTPLFRIKRRGLLRNACIALGNTGDKRALAPLEKAAGDAEPLIAEHARWAMDEIYSRPID